MRTTSDNPGAFRVATPSARAIASRFVTRVRKREFRSSALGLVVDALNLLEARGGARLRPRFRCTCCGYEAHAFRHVLSSGNLVWNSACPACDSRSRHRGLALLLPTLLDRDRPNRILHFAPEPVLRPAFEKFGVRYETADLFLTDTTYSGVDLQKLPFASGTYDLVVCNHVLEHVADDSKAISEIARILGPSGSAVVTVPGNFKRANTIYFEGELPNGHYRDYGLDFVNRLRSSFQQVHMVDMRRLNNSDISNGIKSGDIAFLCSPNPAFEAPHT